MKAKARLLTEGCEFGSIDVETGELSEGYTKNGEMKFKKEPWYKRLFRKTPSETECLGATEIFQQYIWSDKKTYFEVPVYRKFNPYTGRTQKLYSNVGEGDSIEFEVDIYEKTGRFVQKP